MGPMHDRRVPTPELLRKLEWAAVLVLLLAALLPRARDVAAPFDREFDGFQGATFTTFAVNYERLGFGAAGGYPVYNIDLDESAPETWYVYANHSPLMAWVTWASMALLAPDGWEDAWRDGQAPVGVEFAARLPFLALHMFGLFAFWWMLRQGTRATQALIGLALLAVLPVSALYGSLINFETPSIPFVLVAYGCYVRWVRGAGARARARALVGVALAFGIASSFTYAPLFFVPPLALDALARRGLRSALAAGGAATLGVLPPLLVHGFFATRALELTGQSAAPLLVRGRTLLQPLLDGSGPAREWILRQVSRAFEYDSEAIALAAALGLALLLVRLFRKRDTAGRPGEVDVALPLFAGSYLMLFCFYRHTFDEPPQTTFLLNPAPAIAALAAIPLAALAPRLERLRGGIAPLVVLVSLVLLPALARTNALRHAWRSPGPRDDPPGAEGPDSALPPTAGARLAEVLPPGSVGLYPAALGFNFATFWYAWRTLLPVTSDLVPSAGAAEDAIVRFGLGDRPRYLMLPVDPPPFARAEVDAIRAAFAELLPGHVEAGPAAVTEHWEAWRL